MSKLHKSYHFRGFLFLGGGALAFGFAMIAAPWWVGIKLEENQGALLREVNDNTDEVRFSIRDWERGARSSQATLELDIRGDIGREFRNEMNAPLRFEIPVTIQHGPILLPSGKQSINWGWGRATGSANLSRATARAEAHSIPDDVDFFVDLDKAFADVTARGSTHPLVST